MSLAREGSEKKLRAEQVTLRFSSENLVNSATLSARRCAKMERGLLFVRIFGSTLICISLVSQVVSEERTVRYKIYEEVRPPTVIGTLASNVTWTPDKTRRTFPGIRFKLMSPSTGSFIRFRESDGRLTVEERVDRERICKRNPRCVITLMSRSCPPSSLSSFTSRWKCWT